MSARFAPHGDGRSWLISSEVNGRQAKFFPYRFLQCSYEWRPKRRNRREKCNSKILINGSILARVHYKTKPWVERRKFCNWRRIKDFAEFILENQMDKAKRRRLTRPQGAFGYTEHNKGKWTQNHELA
ncbi:MAG: hypothetical protein WAN43_06645 [Rhodomicrobium sp.]